MTEDRTAQIVTLKRRELAKLHADELNAALFPQPGLSDDELSEDQKAGIKEEVVALRARHAREVDAWMKANL
jgi:hypothetical protein